MPPRMLIVDASHLLRRGFLVVPTDRKSPTKQPTNALYAVAGALSRALSFKRPDAAVAILDRAAEAKLLSNALLPSQIAALPALLAAHGLTVLEASESAALVAAYTRGALDAGYDVLIAASDKRFAQLVGPSVWWYDAYKDVRYTPELVRKRFEVGPDKVAGWLALVGDDDQLEGVAGIGKKGATDLVAQYGSVEQALERAEEIAGRTGKMLRASLETARQEIARATLSEPTPLPRAIGELAYAPPPGVALNAAFEALGFFELLSSQGPSDRVEVETCTDPDAVARAVAALGSGPVALELLVERTRVGGATLSGIALSGSRGAAAYFPITGPLSTTPALEPLRAWLEDPARPKVAHEANSALVALSREGLSPRGFSGDTAAASHLTEPSNWAPHDLEVVAKHRIHRTVPDEESVRGVGAAAKPWSKLSVDAAARYAGARAEAISELWASFEPELERAQLAEYLELGETVARMELRGIACSAEDLARAGDDFTAIAEELTGQIHAIAGKPFNIGSTKQLGSVLYEDLKLPIVKRTKTGWSTANEALERIEHAHPIVALVMRWREVQRLKDSWVTALREDIEPDGRVRSTFHVSRSFSGRIINTQPDLGRVPGKTPEMIRIRQAFQAPRGTALMSIDYHQLGLFVLAHLSGDPALVEPLARGDDLHKHTASAVLGVPLDAVTRDQRQLGKVVNFATFAGQGPSALALQLGLPAQEAQALIARFDAHYAGVRAYQDTQLERAARDGVITTIAGRKWPIGGLSALDPMVRSNAERMARRAGHEGSVADVSRRGLLLADRALRAANLLSAPLLQVHDEVLFEVPEAEIDACAALAAAAMRGAFELRVPLRVGCKVGPSWGELVARPM
ncbi:MAG: DNA polymerase [Polyangiaceae bacterium]